MNLKGPPAFLISVVVTTGVGVGSGFFFGICSTFSPIEGKYSSSITAAFC